MKRRPRTSTIFPYTTLFRSSSYDAVKSGIADMTATVQGYTANRFPMTQIIELPGLVDTAAQGSCALQNLYDEGDRKSTRLNSSHVRISYAVFCLKKKKSRCD